MVSSSDSFNTLETKKFYIILPNDNSGVYKYYKVKLGAKKVKEGFEYSSEKNGKFLSVSDIKKIIKDEEKK